MPCDLITRPKSKSAGKKKQKALTRAGLIIIVRAAAQRCAGRFLTLAHFKRLTGITSAQINRLFPNRGWRYILKLAGLKCSKRDVWSEHELLTEFHRVARLVDGVPNWTEFDGHGIFNPATLSRRFRSWQRMLLAYRAWLEKHHPRMRWLADLPQPRPSLPEPPEILRKPPTPTFEYGTPLNFRALSHAPTDEYGVIFLFGQVATELGFIIESLRKDFPDCQALRCVDKKRNRWQRLRLEFEFQSKNFSKHSHDPNECDLIVCWQHDWPACPLEV